MDMNMNISLEELDFSVSTWKGLRKAGIDTLGALAEKSVDDLLAISNLGRKSLAEIAGKLQELGLVLEGYNPDAGKVVYRETEKVLPAGGYWSEVRNDYFEDGIDALEGDVLARISIDAWKTQDDNEEGCVIACVMLSKHGDVLVDYRDPVARVDEVAQEAINEAKEQLRQYFMEQQKEVNTIEYARDFGNGYKVQMVFANQLSDGAYGDIYDLKQDVLREHPNDGILIGYCVVDTVEGIVPLGCNDWNNTVAEAIADYTDNVVPSLQVRDMQVHSWDDMQLKYPMGREEMSEEEEAAFVADCYKLYEEEGFSTKYWSPFTDNAERVGLPIEIIGRIEEDSVHDLGSLPMWKAKLDGCEFEVFPEEVVPSEMKANECRWFEDVLEYDSAMIERVAGLPVDVMSPQEMADTTGKAVKDGNKYYLPKDIVPSVDSIIENAEERTVSSAVEGKDKDLEIV